MGESKADVWKLRITKQNRKRASAAVYFPPVSNAWTGDVNADHGVHEKT